MIKEYRMKKNYTQEQLAEILEISPRQLQRIEKDENNTKISTLKKMIKILDIPDSEIIGFMKKVEK
ncbi:MAG: helix-turn-helix transcriptional regulator [Clostridia bacterium]|nr:helix-turn-helix transcriptional regulator [Clostridia bacterium]